jgi:uncharacterized membrane-anchored protein
MEKLNKVASITIFFWIMKIIATTLGETLGDLLSMTLNIGYTISLVITMFFFIIVLLAQLKASKYYPALYWLVIVGTTTVGTEISDYMDRTLGLGYAIGSAVLFSALLLTLLLWHKNLKRINIYPIFLQKEELYYWIAILFSNSLGTAFGDFLSDVIGLSYLQGALVTAGIIAMVIMLHYYTKLNHILLFWIAFIFTRPFGATFGDLLTKPIAKGGLDLGTIPATLVSVVLLTVLIIYTTRKQKKLESN